MNHSGYRRNYIQEGRSPGLPVGQEIILRRGEKPLATILYDIEKDESCRKVTKKYEENMGEEDHTVYQADFGPMIHK